MNGPLFLLMSAVGFFNLLTTPAPISASNPPLRFLISQRLKSTSSNCNISDAFIFTTLQTPSLRTAISSMADFDYRFDHRAYSSVFTSNFSILFLSLIDCLKFYRLVMLICSFVNPAVAEIIVVRHGETAWNADGRIQVLRHLQTYKISFK